MLIYILLPVVLFVTGSFLCREKARKVDKIMFALLFGLVIFVLAACRSFVGTDYKSYAQLYDYFNYNDNSAYLLAHEKGFVVPLEILNELFPSYQAMFIAIALIVAVGVTYYMCNNSSNLMVSSVSFVCFGMLFYSMNFMRQFIAGIIIMYAVNYISSKSFIRYLALVLLASCFHWSALVMIPFYFIMQIKLEPLVLAAYSIIAVMLAMFSDDIISFGLETFYTKYQSDYTIDTGAISPAYLICYGIILILAFILRKRLYEKDPRNSVYLSCLFFVVMFELLGTVNAVLSRFTLLFILPPFISLIPEIVDAASEVLVEKYGRNTMMKILTFVVFLIIAGSFYAWLLSVNSNGALPYRTVYEYSEPLW